MQRLKSNLSFLFILTAIITLIIMSISCNDNPVVPGDEPPPGRRDYVWTIDTLDLPLTDLRLMWGSTPNDVWVIGAGGHLSNLLWHFDGISWSSYGEFSGTLPYGIKGFASDDIWIGGQMGNISHYDGTAWEKVYQIPNPGYFDFYGIQNFEGESSDNMYAVGFADSAGTRISLIYHYDGIAWKRLSSGKFNMNFYSMKKEDNSKRYYIEGLFPDSNAAILFENGKFDFIDNDRRTYQTNITMQKIGSNIYMTKGQEIFQLNGKEKRFIYRIDDENFGLQSYGRNSKDIFLRMFDGVAHYNGINHEYLTRFDKRMSIRDVLLFEKEVFITVYDWDNYINYIYRGKLQEK